MNAVDDALRDLLEVAAGRRNLTGNEVDAHLAALEDAASAAPAAAADAAPEPGPED